MSTIQSAQPVDVHPVANRGLGRQLVINSIATGTFYAVSLVVGLWYTRFTFHSLGVSTYAVVGLAAGFITYMQFVTNWVGSSVGRFVLSDVARGDMHAANRTFNTYLIAAERVTTFVLGIIGVIVLFVVPFLDYPAGQLGATRFVFVAILGGQLVQVWAMCFDSAIWVSGRLDVRNAILIIEMLVRVGTVYALFSFDKPSLWYVGVASIVSSATSISLYVLAWRKLAPELYIDRKLFNPERFKEIRGLGSWLLIQQLGGALLFSTDVLILNLILGRAAQGYYNMILTWVNILRGLFASMGLLLSPSIAAYQAGDEKEKLATLCVQSLRMQGLLISIPVGVLCGLARPALEWWIGPEVTFLAPLTWLILVPLVIEGAFYPPFALLQTPQLVKLPAKITLAVGITHVLLDTALVKFTGLGLYGIGLSAASMSILRTGVILPIYTARVLGKPWYTMVEQICQILIQLAITGGIALYVSQYLAGRSLINLVAAALVAGAIAAVIALAQLHSDERNWLLRRLRLRPAAS